MSWIEESEKRKLVKERPRKRGRPRKEDIRKLKVRRRVVPKTSKVTRKHKVSTAEGKNIRHSPRLIARDGIT